MKYGRGRHEISRKVPGKTPGKIHFTGKQKIAGYAKLYVSDMVIA